MPHPSDALLARDAELRAQYHTLATGDARPSELAEVETAILENVAAVSAAIAEGADPCPKCEGPATGRLKTPARVDRGAEISPVYEIGCIACDLKARAASPEKTVAAWNDGKLVDLPQ